MEEISRQNKDELQLERIIMFSDGIFAIAITLLIIEIKVPEIHSQVTDKVLWESLIKILPKFIGFVVSFFVIGLYWVGHHRMFKYINRSSSKLIWANLSFMFPIVVMPFSSAFFSEYYSSSLHVPLGVYALTICLAGLFNFRLWRIIGNPKNKLSNTLNRTIVLYNSTRALTIPIVFLSVFVLSFVTPYAYFLPPFIPLVTKVIDNYFTKRYPYITN